MLDKIANAEYPIHDLIARRWSPRAFSARRVEADKLLSLFEAARWAASSSNEQPWSFLVASIDNSLEHEELASCLVPGNAWARRAPVLVLSVASLDFAKNASPNRHGYHDVGLAVENLVIQALSMDLFVHQMAGFDVEKARKIFEVPPRHDPVAMIAIGYLGDPESLTEDQRLREKAPRQRKPMHQFLFAGKWGRTSPLIPANQA